ncbi:Uncharacterised protein [Legionella wadsworthii]|uniref:Uncharacterized protein n=1 Tax=Legionella wadsworthii TaxID=28088 RepID=A0A378LNE0_9GAMM|nr:hypothetical protein [Legionella wadsworthii]STY28495.1 Uncharacterised protein [Legionella wadsworthii]
MKGKSMKGLFFLTMMLANNAIATSPKNNSNSKKEKNNTNDNDTYNRICNTNGFFANKVVGNYQNNPEVLQNIYEVGQIRRQYLPNIDLRIRNVESMLMQQKDTLFQGNKYFEPLKAYIQMIAQKTEVAKIRREKSSGFCGEASAASIVNSLYEQLKSGHRETVQEIMIEVAGGSTNHAFVLYNGPRLESQQVDNKKIEEIMRIMKSPHKGDPIICDEFEHYYGPASKWYEKFFNAEDHDFDDGQYTFMHVTDYTLPPLHKAFNSEQRKYIKTLLMDLLSEVPICSNTGDKQNCPLM